jgi:hypothetical protein
MKSEPQRFTPRTTAISHRRSTRQTPIRFTSKHFVLLQAWPAIELAPYMADGVDALTSVEDSLARDRRTGICGKTSGEERLAPGAEPVKMPLM